MTNIAQHWMNGWVGSGPVADSINPDCEGSVILTQLGVIANLAAAVDQ